MAKACQPFFQSLSNLAVKEFGGSLIKGNAREARPIALKRPMHLVMRSSYAKKEKSFLRPERARRIHQIIHRVGTLSGVKIYRYANSGNHLHLVIRARSRRSLSNFLRAVSGIIARLTLGAERGKARGLKFWDARPFSRILEWGREYQNVSNYLLQNTLEALGFIPYQARARQRPESSA